MTVVYRDYARAKTGVVLGMAGWQLGIVVLAGLPILVAMQTRHWAGMVIAIVQWLIVFALTVVPVRGRSAVGWLIAVTATLVGRMFGWTRFRAKAATGSVRDPRAVDLPGVLSGVEIHDGPPRGPLMQRPAVIQHHAAKTWSMTASAVHPGIRLSEADDRARFGRGLSEMLEAVARSELVEEVMLMVRTVPEDPTERQRWIERHRSQAGPQLARRVNDELATFLARAAVRTEIFVTLVVPETRIARPAKEFGGGREGRARALYNAAEELEAHLRGGVGMSAVSWLTSPELAAACRTGWAPGDRAAITEAMSRTDGDGNIDAAIPWAMAGPSGAEAQGRHYSHDAWNSVSSAILLPDKGAVMGALAPLLTPGPAERRSLLVVYPVLRQRDAQRKSAKKEWSADIGDELRRRVGSKPRAGAQRDNAQARALDGKLADGNAMTLPWAVCTTTAPRSASIAEYAHRLDTAIRGAGFSSLRMDLAQDAAFAASVVPLGVSLTRARGTL